MSTSANDKPSDYYDRYSRQHYVLGERAMNKMSKSNVFISGLGGLGVEIAKNVALAGVRKLTIHDDKNATFLDMSTQYYIGESDIGSNRASVSYPRISELNPYVQFNLDTRPFDDNTEDLEFLKEFTCIVLTEKSLSLQKRVNNFCRENNISFIAADTYGAFAWAFNDPGKEHEVFDKNGENALQVFIESIKKGTETIVEALENHMHGFEEGDFVKFEEVKGMTQLNYSVENEFVHKVKTVLSPYAFTIETDSTSFNDYTTGGIATQVKVPVVMNFATIEESIEEPNLVITDFCKFSSPSVSHIGMQALHAYVAKNGSLPSPWNKEHAESLLSLAIEINEKSKAKTEIDEKLIKQLAYTARGGIIGLTAFLGGAIAQEVIKNLSGKFTPLNQWLYLDAVEILPDYENADFDASKYQPVGSRYDAQIILIGQENNEKVRNINTFIIGSGAIGCEMLKNFAMLGISTGNLGKITVTDNDLIEKSNLNRQFLFREADLQKPKSVTAAKAAKQMNKDMNIESFVDKVCDDTEAKFSNSFFQTLDVVVNALDNVEARLYVDQRCTTNLRPLMESGTLGSKGHVQVILPHKTETYASQRDPPDESFPVCTVKSFPSMIEHTIQWARSKFDTLFNEQPAEIAKFFEDKAQYIESLKGSKGPRINVLKHLIKTVEKRPTSYEDCVAFARIKFESYFQNLILNLLNAFPLDCVLKDGTLFWKSPKRPPTPVKFDINEKLHYDFITSTAQLYANVYNISVDRSKAVDKDYIASVVQNVVVPEFKPKNKKIETDPNAKPTEEVVDADELETLTMKLEELSKSVETFSVTPQEFEKDDDTNHHIDFIASCSNLRASNYKINNVERLEAKRISGKIIPAIATTTAVVSGLVSIEVVKVILGIDVDKFKSAFLNLALPAFQLSEPGPAPKTYITKDTYFTVWDTWEVKEGDITIEELVSYFKKKYSLTVTGIFEDVKVIYAALMPLHKGRLKKKLSSFIKGVDLKKQNYVDLIVSFENESGNAVDGPTVRFFIEK